MVCQECNSDLKLSSIDFYSDQLTARTKTKNYLGARFETVYVRDYIYIKGTSKLLFQFEVAIDDQSTYYEEQNGILGLCP